MFSKLHHRKPHNGGDGNKEKDVEANGEGAGAASSSSGDGDNDNLGEYAALDRYISTYRDDNLREDDGSVAPRRKPWWKFWQFQDEEEPRKNKGPGIPDDWLDTDIKSGIRSDQVEERRKRTGFNELTAEKENMFEKILGYFTGPILYSKLVAMSSLLSSTPARPRCSSLANLISSP